MAGIEESFGSARVAVCLPGWLLERQWALSMELTMSERKAVTKKLALEYGRGDNTP